MTKVVTAEGLTPLEAARAVKASQQVDKVAAWKAFLKAEREAYLAICDEATRKAWADLWRSAPPWASTNLNVQPDEE